jgi:hypothetical protein
MCFFFLSLFLSSCCLFGFLLKERENTDAAETQHQKQKKERERQRKPSPLTDAHARTHHSVRDKRGSESGDLKDKDENRNTTAARERESSNTTTTES